MYFTLLNEDLLPESQEMSFLILVKQLMKLKFLKFFKVGLKLIQFHNQISYFQLIHQEKFLLF
jgi:hypothetical protein